MDKEDLHALTVNSSQYCICGKRLINRLASFLGSGRKRDVKVLTLIQLLSRSIEVKCPSEWLFGLAALQW